MKVVMIIPTYNEKENIVKLIPALQDVFKCIPHTMEILVVDDNSPDGTAGEVEVFQRTIPTIHLLQGEKKGLGSAYIRGMRYAIETLEADAVMEMDADFSHKPEDVPRMVKELDAHDFIIGSRYVPGGKIPDEWTLFRRMNSWGGNICARFIAGMYRVRDCTAGFRAIRGSVLRKINLENLKVEGYCFQINLLHQALVNKARVKEIPVIFVDRTLGTSKLGIKDIIEFLIAVWVIRLETSKTFIKFCAVGLSGVLVNLGIFTALLSVGMNKFIASPVAVEASIVTNFLLNNYWTFASRKKDEALRIRGLKFNIVSVLSLIVSYLIFVLIMVLYPKTIPQVAQVVGIVPATITNYFLNSYWTFKKK